MPAASVVHVFEELLAEEPARLVELEDRAGLLACLSAAQPGAHVMQVLVLLDPLSLSADERVDYLLAWERCAAWVAAQSARALAAMGRPVPGEEPTALSRARAEEDWVREEVAVALRLSPGGAHRRLELARALDERLGSTWAALARGEISVPHALTLAEGVAGLEPRVVEAVQERVLTKAREQTPGQLRAAVRHAVLMVDPAGSAGRHEQARAGRRVERWELAEGMAALYAELPAEQAALAWSVVDAHARGLREDDRAAARTARDASQEATSAVGGQAEVRGLDACRANALVATLLTADAAATGTLGADHTDAARPALACRPRPLPVAPRQPRARARELPATVRLLSRPGPRCRRGCRCG